MRSLIWLLFTSSASISIAQPTIRPRDASASLMDPNSWTPVVRAYFEAVGKKFAKAREAPNFPGAPPCDLSKAMMPIAPTPLPPPSDGLTLTHVAIGRGTQNYTCAPGASKPVAAGALAKLYNATCTAATYPDLLALVPNAVLSFNTPSDDDKTMSPSSLFLSGHHYFPDPTTPVFDMGTKKDFYGFAVCAKSAQSPAPPDAPKGPNGLGSVPWLKLGDKGGSSGIKEVYRVNTAGGVPPATCDDHQGDFQVDYAAEYWFYG
ncbi:MAG: hypothetical protein M1816_003977 [Peltula sp. TS41687]|nr:MAG: hypothetical protein M1816_003977 [Peltula sp. TS41687]